MKLDNDVVASILEAIISDLSYDSHKFLLSDPFTGENQYPDLAADFIEMYENFGK